MMKTKFPRCFIFFIFVLQFLFEKESLAAIKNVVDQDALKIEEASPKENDFNKEKLLFSHKQKTLKDFSISQLAEKLQKSVVNISAEHVIKGKEQVEDEVILDPKDEFDESHPFKNFFDYLFKEKKDQSLKITEKTLGSGFVIDAKEGYVLTNNHVILDANDITVIFSDGKTLSAKKIGVDPQTDLALLKVNPTIFPLHEVQFANSQKARIGDWVIAIGNPYGFGGSVTLGIISALNRDINSGPYDEFIQTDAAINRGNSGGPLFDLNGQVLGVNTAIISPNGGSVGIGLSIPSQMVMPVVEQLKQYGEVRRGFLGIRIQPVTPLLAKALGFEKTKDGQEPPGALISGKMELSTDNKVDNHEIEPFDIIKTFNGQEIKNVHSLAKIIAETPAEKKVKVEIFRKGKDLTVDVQLGRLNNKLPVEEEKKLDKNLLEKDQQKISFLKMGVLESLNPKLREKYGIPAERKGFVFTKIQKNSDLDNKNVKAGDVLVQLNQQDLSSLQIIQSIIQKAIAMGRQNIMLLISKPNGDLQLITTLIKN